ncbi:MAG: decaprenyl-phosphate phosphoribosyltransferase [Pseudomonadota bacterium]|nr:MAG: decaprenyl-phosphate phosphoribosyltransferase [Pseudomonadota bacterium]
MRVPAEARHEELEQGQRTAATSVLALLEAMRPHQWAKNAFVLAPLIFSRNLFDLSLLAQAVHAFFLFSFTASAVYLANDVLDRETDRLHPVKRNRPIASGRLSPRIAMTAAAVLCLGSLAGGLVLGLPFATVLLGYLVLNSLYSLWLKRIAWVDVTVIALGFVLRVVAGALAIGVAISHWIFVCTFAVALYLALGKRKHEILAARHAGKDQTAARKALGAYAMGHLDLGLRVAGAFAVLSYFLYTVSPDTVDKFGTWLLALTVPFPALGIWRFGQLLMRASRASSPTEAILTDAPFLANVGVWLLSVVVIVYVAGS